MHSASGKSRPVIRGPEAVAARATRSIAEIYLVRVREDQKRSHRRFDAYHPTIVIGCARVKRTRRAMFNSRKALATTATASCMALTMVSHGGSGRNGASATLAPPRSRCLHGRTRAQMLKADATGPRVPAIIGNAEDANHHRLLMLVREQLNNTLM